MQHVTRASSRGRNSLARRSLFLRKYACRFEIYCQQVSVPTCWKIYKIHNRIHEKFQCEVSAKFYVIKVANSVRERGPVQGELGVVCERGFQWQFYFHSNIVCGRDIVQMGRWVLFVGGIGTRDYTLDHSGRLLGIHLSTRDDISPNRQKAI